MTKLGAGVRSCLFAVCVALMAPMAASAQTDDAGAKAHFQAGANYFSSASYADALREFNRAYELSQKPELFFNISLCYQNLGDFDQAITYLDKYMTAVPNAANKPQLDERMANLKKLRDQRDAVTMPPPSDSGSGAATTTKESDELPAIEAPVVTPGDQRTADEDEGGGIPTASLVSFIVGGAGVVAFATFGILAMGEDSSLADGCGKDKSCTDDDVSALKTDALIADIGLGVAVVGAGLGVLFWVLDSGEEQAPSGSASLRVAPFVTPSTAGAALSGRF